MAAASPSRVWADLVDEGMAAAEGQEQEKESSCASGELEGMSVGVDAAAFCPSDLPSLGSDQHRNARCKPCAFFHTKGCENDKACNFCHLCPPGEKARRKRLRERMCEKLGQSFQKDGGDRRFQKSGHLRQASGGSTQSTCSGWTNFSHSRQSSGSSVALPAQEAGMVGTHMGGNGQWGQMMPVYHWPAQSVMPPLVVAAEGDATVDPASLPSRNQTTPIALAQAVPFPEAAGQCGAVLNATEQVPYQPMGMMQYALVQVPVNGPLPGPMVQPSYNMDGSMSYVCYGQQPHSQMMAMPGNCVQWAVQVDQRGPLANANCAPASETLEAARSEAVGVN